MNRRTLQAPAVEPAPSIDLSRLEWDNAAEGRTPRDVFLPDLPLHASPPGEHLRVDVSFSVSPQGFTTSVQNTRSSGYTDVDTAVVSAVRRWTFNPVSGSRSVGGRVTFFVEPRK